MATLFTMRNRCTFAGALFVALMLASCGGKSPTQPAASGPTASADPVARVQVKVDDGTQREALASMSDVAVDASASTGSGALTFSIDFGDGTSATTATARHTYAAPGTFTVVATVADAQGRKATGSSQVTVKAVTGRWYQAEYVRRSDRVEVRQLTITSQDGLSVRGIYGTTGNTDRSFAGTLTRPREIRIAISGGAGLIGILPDRLNDSALIWTLAAQGDSVDGERLDFHAIVGEPTDAAPRARLKLVFDAVRGGPIVSLSPVLFDGTASTGSGLTYFIEFGDGTSAIGSHATRVVENYGTARLTVVDGFGRSDTDSWPYSAFGLSYPPLYALWQSDDGRLSLGFYKRSGVNYTGDAWCYSSGPDCFDSTAATATLSGLRDILVTVPSRAITYRGTIETNGSMTLVQSGGAGNGKTWRLLYRAYDPNDGIR